jgi:hypothetical protein
MKYDVLTALLLNFLIFWCVTLYHLMSVVVSLKLGLSPYCKKMD